MRESNKKRIKGIFFGVWVPAFAGMTKVGEIGKTGDSSVI
jgi:hypothetical protein